MQHIFFIATRPRRRTSEKLCDSEELEIVALSFEASRENAAGEAHLAIVGQIKLNGVFPCNFFFLEISSLSFFSGYKFLFRRYASFELLK